jgi:2-polyprenyl-3-methyl-5-hydroxy-6-metoxy-1,4-benzoquinol methylase
LQQRDYSILPKVILDEQTWNYLNGAAFSNGGSFTAGSGGVVARNDLIAELSRGMRVLHVGCADHAPLIAAKRADGVYLHDRIAHEAASVTGLDVDERALDDMRRLGITDLYTPSTLPADRTFDLVVAADVIEHVSDVGRFLRALAVHDAPVLVTTPNALRLRNRRLWTTELVNTDHRYWFSPYTLAKSLVEAGLMPTTFWYTDVARLTRGDLLRPWEALLKRRFPLCRDGLAVMSEPKSPPGA